MSRILANPISQNQRIDFLDVLRGIALLGVLIVNIYQFNKPPESHVNTSYYTYGSVNTILVICINFLITGKFYTIFSFLFGLGFAVQMNRWKDKVKSPKKLFIRRVTILLIIGLVHVLLIWSGDILILYAINGFLLVLYAKSSPKKIIRWAFSLFTAFYLVLIVAAFATYYFDNDDVENVVQTEEVVDLEQSNEIVDETVIVLSQEEIYLSGNYFIITKERFFVFVSEYLPIVVLSPLIILPLFLFGAYFGKRKIFENLSDNRRLFKRMALWGSFIGFPLTFINLYYFLNYEDIHGQEFYVINTLFQQLSYPFVAAAYVGILALSFEKIKNNTLLNGFRNIGKTALSNYLLQSIVFTIIFFSYGFNLARLYNPGILFMMSILFFFIQIIISGWWLKFYSYGPLEWIWRSLTYGKKQSMAKSKV